MVKYNLEIGKDFALISPELKDKYPKMVDIDSKGNPLKKVAKQKSVYVYVNAEGKESKPAGKGIEKEGRIIPLNKVSNLKAVKVERVDKSKMFEYAIKGEFEVRKTSIELKENEAITFLWALSKGYLNTYRGFIYKENGRYWLVKTTISTKEQLSKGKVVDETGTEQEFTKADEQLKTLGMET